MRKLLSKPNVDSADGDYLYGKIRDKVDGTQEGTPVTEQVYGDQHQFFERLMAMAGITPNDLPDNDYNGWQLFDALLTVIQNNLPVAENWQNATLAPGWTDNSSPYPATQYYKDGAGIVRMRGIPFYSSGSSGSNIVLTTLPVNYRPQKPLRFACWFDISSASITSFSKADQWTILVDTNGEVRLMNYVNISGTVTIDLSSIQFRTDQ